MIENDKEFHEYYKEYLKSKGIKQRTDVLCDGIDCKDCLFKGLICSTSPFKDIENYEKRIAVLKEEIDIMQNWKRNHEIDKKLKDFCKTLRTINLNSVFTCHGINCNDCLFNNMDNFSEWMRQAKTRGEEG